MTDLTPDLYQWDLQVASDTTFKWTHPNYDAALKVWLLGHNTVWLYVLEIGDERLEKRFDKSELQTIEEIRRRGMDLLCEYLDTFSRRQ